MTWTVVFKQVGLYDWMQTLGLYDWMQTLGLYDWMQTLGLYDWMQTLGLNLLSPALQKIVSCLLLSVIVNHSA